MNDRRQITSPSLVLTALEPRSAFEYATWPLARPFLNRLRRGDGHPVLVLPGFVAADRSTLMLRALLRKLGYRVYGWKLGANLGPTPQIVEGLTARFEQVHAREGRPVSLIGWSLGGIYARELARQHHEVVRQVITMGSPIRMVPGDESAVSPVWDALSHLHDPDAIEAMAGRDRPPLQMPTTSIYTRTDGIVHWKACLEERGPIAENVEVIGSHSGLGFNPSVAIVVADRLAQQVGQWRRFRPPVWAAGAFPRPANWKPGPDGTLSSVTR